MLSGTVACALAWGKNYEEGEYGFDLVPPSFLITAHSSNRKPQFPSTRIPLLASVAGSMVTRTTSRIAFKRAGRGLVTADMIPDIGGAFAECFGESSFWGEDSLSAKNEIRNQLEAAEIRKSRS